VFGHHSGYSHSCWAQPNSSLAFTFATTTAPAARNFLVTAAPYRVGLCPRREPASSPSMFMLSWSTTGTPCNRPRGTVCSPPLSKLRAVSRQIEIDHCIDPRPHLSWASIRLAYSWSNLSEESIPASRARLISRMVVAERTNLLSVMGTSVKTSVNAQR